MTKNPVNSLPYVAEYAMKHAKGEAATNGPRPLIETQALTQGYRPLTLHMTRDTFAQAPWCANG